MSDTKRNRIQFNDSSPEDLDIQETFDKKQKQKDTDKKKPEKEALKTATKTEKRTPSNSTVSLLSTIKQLFSFLLSDKFRRILGVCFIFLGAYAAVATVSYFFTWQEDQDKVLAPAAEFYAVDTKISNWLGKIGALISHYLVYKTFGVSSLLLSFIVLLFGFYLLFKTDKLVWLRKIASKSVFFLMWVPILLAFLFHDKWLYLGGGYGFVANAYFSSFIGKTGTALVLGASLIVYLIIAYNFSFDFSWAKLNLNKDEEEVIEAAELAPTSAAYDKFSAVPVYLEPEQTLTEEEKAAMLNFEFKKIDQTNDADNAPLATDVKRPILDLEDDTILSDDIIMEDPPEEKTSMQDEFESANVYGGETKVSEAKNGEVEFQVQAPIVENYMNDDVDAKAKDLVQEFGEYDSTLDLGNYQPPTIDLLFDYPVGESGVNTEELTANKNRIVDTLKNYGIEIDKIKATIGPTVTLYEIVPAAGVRISKIKNLEDDIALSLSALGIRIIAPIPGKGTIGIEVPNQHPEMVPMKNIFNSEKFIHTTFDLPIALGKTISNETFIADLAKMPHLLMAGATGQGKSVGLNAILVSLLYKKHPSQIKFVLVDPKKVELTLFNKIERHFLAKLPDSEESIITDTKKVVHTLNSLCIEMDNRYELLKDAQVRNIKEYNTKFVSRKLNPNEGHKYLPYIVLVVDEFADLIMTAGKEVEMPIARLAQLARAIGIHLIIATQRPSVNIITGTIKANFPARIAFRVTSKIDSRTILDTGGAEQLIGRGDMLLSTGNDLTRIQCAFVDTPEVEKITDFIGSQRAYPTAFLLPEFIDENAEQEKDIDLADRDKMFDEAARIIVNHQQGSASLLQRKLKLGYNRAGRIVDQLESAGIIGKFEGSKARDVLIKDIVSLEEILNNLNNKV
jgi:DNA segregation ATPase FtsK/SpoIIIE, S-DNA-T family